MLGEMKYFEETKPGKIKMKECDMRIFSIKKNEDPEFDEGKMIRIREESDGWFSGYFTREEAIELFQEAIDWIKQGDKKMTEIKKHARREIGEWKEKSLDSYWIHLYCGGSVEIAEKACREACFPSGLCVTIEKVKYVFGGGTEDGVRIRFIDYPPFPDTELLEKAADLGKKIIDVNFQFSFSIVTPSKTIFYSRVK